MVGAGDLGPIDLTDLDVFAGGFPHEIFRTLRASEPVWWHEPTEHTPDATGFWVVSTHAGVVEVVSDATTFSSERAPGAPGGGTLIQDLPYGSASGVLLNMTDDPRHQEVRRIVTPALAPRALAAMELDLRRRASAIVETMASKEHCDFLLEVAVELPLQATAVLLGVPEDDRHDLMAWSNATLDHSGRELGESSAAAEQAAADTAEYGMRLVADRRRDPDGDDMLSMLCRAGAGLSDLELLMFFSLLIAAGSETTRNAIALGMEALVSHPAELETLRSHPEAMGSAVEEILRWTSPTLYNRRTATRAAELGGKDIRAGDKVTMWWASANRDESVFSDPSSFDVRRTPNPHLSFGHRSHFCLGAMLARMEIRIMFEHLLARFEDFELDGPVERFRTNKHAGVSRMPLRYKVRRP